MLRPVGFISLEIREGGVRGGRDHRMSEIVEGWRIYFLLFLGSLFCVRFLFVFLEALEGPLGVMGSILGSFGEHFGLILVIFSGQGGSLKTCVLL